MTAQVRSGTVAEVGTGCGVGASWIASGLRTGTAFITVESDPRLAAAVERHLADISNVRVLSGDWREILAVGPFALLFVDASEPKQHAAEELLRALEIGGMIVFDDLTPGGTGRLDPLREFWLNDPRVASAELLVSPAEAVILAARLS